MGKDFWGSLLNFNVCDPNNYVFIYMLWGGFMLGSGIEKKKKELYDKTEDLSDNLFSYDEIENLPEPVQRYFRNVLEEGQSYISNAEL